MWPMTHGLTVVTEAVAEAVAIAVTIRPKDMGVGTARSWTMGQTGAPMMPSRLPSTWKLVSSSQAAGVLNP